MLCGKIPYKEDRMSDRFELENRISQFGNFANIIRDLSHCIMEYDLSTDEVVNALEGIAVTIDNHERLTFDTFIQTLKLDQYNEHTNAIHS